MGFLVELPATWWQMFGMGGRAASDCLRLLSTTSCGCAWDAPAGNYAWLSIVYLYWNLPVFVLGDYACRGRASDTAWCGVVER